MKKLKITRTLTVNTIHFAKIKQDDHGVRAVEDSVDVITTEPLDRAKAEKKLKVIDNSATFLAVTSQSLLYSVDVDDFVSIATASPVGDDVE